MQLYIEISYDKLRNVVDVSAIEIFLIFAPFRIP